MAKKKADEQEARKWFSRLNIDTQERFERLMKEEGVTSRYALMQSICGYFDRYLKIRYGELPYDEECAFMDEQVVKMFDDFSRAGLMRHIVKPKRKQDEGKGVLFIQFPKDDTGISEQHIAKTVDEDENKEYIRNSFEEYSLAEKHFQYEKPKRNRSSGSVYNQ